MFCATVLAAMLLLGFVMRFTARETRMTKVISDIRTHSNMFINQLGATGGLQSTLTEKMIYELGQAAVLYDGRILITDKSLGIVADTYDMEVGKTLISEEVILALRQCGYIPQ